MRIGLTQRVERTAGDELRDCLAHDWWRLLAWALPEADLVPVANRGDAAVHYARRMGLGGLIFTGGDDAHDGPRAATEASLFDLARREAWPLLGVCRGMQTIQLLSGGALSACDAAAHVGTRHRVLLADAAPGWFGPSGAAREREVLSYHRWGVARDGLAPGLVAWAHDDGGGIEACASADGRAIGVLWHPERAVTPDPFDRALLRHLFGGAR